jgi:hypothetical protein
MRAAIGVRAHSGWAAVVAVAGDGREVQVVDRRRIGVIDAKGPRANQPYHYAQMLPIAEAHEHLDRCERIAVGLAAEALGKMNALLCGAQYELVGCAILQASGRVLPELPQILASHAMIHTAEGQFFRNVFAHACEQIKVPVMKIREKELEALAARELRLTPTKIKSKFADLGHELGPPWTQDQKFAALAAWLLVGQESLEQTQNRITDRTGETRRTQTRRV